MKTIGEMSRAELAALVQERLRTNGIEVILSGGSCVSIYSDERYVSADLDMIHTSLLAPKGSVIREVMSELGFTEDGRYFKHAETDLYVHFPKGPPAIGEEPVKEFHNRRESTGILRILSPTDCVMDRLAGYFHFNDHQCLEQAILVALNNEVDLSEIERWSSSEGKRDSFLKFMLRFERKA